MKKNNSALTRTLLTLLFFFIGAIFIWLAVKYSLAQASSAYQLIGRLAACS